MAVLDPRIAASKIEVFGCDGSEWYISGPDIPQLPDSGVTLSPRLMGAIDAPVKTLWLPGAFGQEAQGIRWQRRDMVFTVQTFADNPYDWQTVDYQWRNAFDYVEETKIQYTTSSGVRYVMVRLMEEPKSYEGDTDNGKSPFLVCDSAVVMTVAAELPFYQGPTIVKQGTGSTAGNASISFTNKSDVPVFPRWVLSAPGTWTLPDRSFGSEEYARGSADASRSVQLPALLSGEGVVADSDPRRQTLLAANRANVQGRWKGNDLLYPIAPQTTVNFQISWTGCTSGAAWRLEVPQWFTRPWGR